MAGASSCWSTKQTGWITSAEGVLRVVDQGCCTTKNQTRKGLISGLSQLEETMMSTALTIDRPRRDELWKQRCCFGEDKEKDEARTVEGQRPSSSRANRGDEARARNKSTAARVTGSGKLFSRRNRVLPAVAVRPHCFASRVGSNVHHFEGRALR
jgi:hypothetical protein